MDFMDKTIRAVQFIAILLTVVLFFSFGININYLIYFDSSLFTIIIFSFTMLLASLLFGHLPLLVELSQNMLHIVTLFGCGILVGTSLGVILPEGIHTLFSSRSRQLNDESCLHIEHAGAGMGLAVILGFIFMMLVDRYFSSHHHNLHDLPNTTNRFSLHHITIGLLVHSATDGLSLAVGSMASDKSLEFLIFLAIMLHKAPTAFGLSSILLNHNLSRSKVSLNIIVFSVSAPTAAIIAYGFIIYFTVDSVNSMAMIGLLLLFSAGTFLFIALVHILPDFIAEKQQFSRTSLIILIFGILFPLAIGIEHSH